MNGPGKRLHQTCSGKKKNPERKKRVNTAYNKKFFTVVGLVRAKEQAIDPSLFAALEFICKDATQKYLAVDQKSVPHLTALVRLASREITTQKQQQLEEEQALPMILAKIQEWNALLISQSLQVVSAKVHALATNSSGHENEKEEYQKLQDSINKVTSATRGLELPSDLKKLILYLQLQTNKEFLEKKFPDLGTRPEAIVDCLTQITNSLNGEIVDVKVPLVSPATYQGYLAYVASIQSGNVQKYFPALLEKKLLLQMPN